MIYNVIYCVQCPKNVSVEKIPSHSKTRRTNMIRNMYRIKFASFQREDCW